MAVNEVGSINNLLEDWDWSHVFGEEDDGNTTGEVMEIPPGCGVSRRPVARTDVVEIVAAVNGENDGDDWVGVFRLKDGRYLIAEGGCDYTGWDCQAGNSLAVCGSLADVIKYGLTEEQKQRLQIEENNHA